VGFPCAEGDGTMTSVADRPVAARPTDSWSVRLLTPAFWGAVAIVVMWLAVLFTSIYGGDFVSVNASATNSTTIPSGIFVALFACLATVAVARRAFRWDTDASSTNGTTKS
jgi:hypothetical protein